MLKITCTYVQISLHIGRTHQPLVQYLYIALKLLTSCLGGLQQILLLPPDNVALHLGKTKKASEQYVCITAVA